MIRFVGEPENEGLAWVRLQGLPAKIRLFFRISMRALCLRVYRHGVRVAKQLLEGFVDIHHQQGDISMVVRGRGEVEADEGADAVAGHLICCLGLG